MRVLRAGERGISTVAVFSEADRTALHRTLRRRGYLLGPAPSHGGATCIDRIIDAARKSGADAIHRLWFSPSAEFVVACADAGITFIGAQRRRHRRHGRQDHGGRETVRCGRAARARQREGAQRRSADGSGARDGFPAHDQGGGRRQAGTCGAASTPALESAIGASAAEAMAAFGNDEVYLEKLITNARHIEIQVLADSHGNTIHLASASAAFSAVTRSSSRKRPVSPSTRRCGRRWSRGGGGSRVGRLRQCRHDRVSFF